jgi:hypothetical protein
LLAKHPHIAKKLGGKTLIDIEAFDLVLDRLPRLERTGVEVVRAG